MLIKKILRKKLIDKKIQKKYGISKNDFPLFRAVFFELRSKCNGRCSFCAASIHHEKRKDIKMPFELYKKAINELSEINFTGRIAFHVNNEPLLFDDLDKFIQVAREKVPEAWIQIKTNGTLLNKERFESLCQSGINEAYVNVYMSLLKEPFPEKIVSLFHSFKNKENPKIEVKLEGNSSRSKKLLFEKYEKR